MLRRLIHAGDAMADARAFDFSDEDLIAYSSGEFTDSVVLA